MIDIQFNKINNAIQQCQTGIDHIGSGLIRCLNKTIVNLFFEFP